MLTTDLDVTTEVLLELFRNIKSFIYLTSIMVVWISRTMLIASITNGNMFYEREALDSKSDCTADRQYNDLASHNTVGMLQSGKLSDPQV